MIGSVILTQVYGTKARGFTLMGEWNSGDRCTHLPVREVVWEYIVMRDVRQKVPVFKKIDGFSFERFSWSNRRISQMDLEIAPIM